MNSDISIWDDPDVQRIYHVQNGQPFPMFHVFNDRPAQLQRVIDWVRADQEAGSDSPPQAFGTACLTGILAVEDLAGSVDIGWLKFFTYMTAVNNHFLWDLHRCPTEVMNIAEWTIETIERHSWNQGNSTPMGQQYSNAMALAAETGGGVRMNPATGRFEAGNGDRARAAARTGHF